MARSGSPYSTPRDANRVPLLVAASTADGITPVVLEADPTTHALVTSGGGTGGGGTQYTDGAAAATHPVGTQEVFTNGSGIVTAVSTANPLPVSASVTAAPNVISTVNSSTTTLSGAGTFTGTSEDVSAYADIRIAVFSDAASAADGLSIQQSTNGTNWDQTDAYTIPAGTGKAFDVPVYARYFRVVYTNGATIQAAFRLQSVYHISRTKPSSQRPQDSRTNDNDMEENLAYNNLYDSGTNTWSRASSGNGTTGLGTQRVTLSSDSTGQVKLAAGANTIGAISNTSFTANQGTAAALTGGWPTINGEAGDVTGTFTNATQTTSVTANNLDGYGNTLISINGTYGTATAIFEGSDDSGTTWYTVQAARDNTNVIETGYTSLTNTSQTWQINNPGFDSLRIRSTAVASGTVNVRLSSSAAPVASGTIVGLGTAIPAGTNLIGKVGIDQTTPGTTNNATISGQFNSTAPTITTGNYSVTQLSNRASVANTPFSLNSGGFINFVADNADGVAVDSNQEIQPVASRDFIYNGSTYDRIRSAGSVKGTTGTGLQAAGALGFDGTNYQVISASTTGVVDVGLMPARTSLNTYSIHLTTNATTTPTAATAYISSITISNEVGGTTSTVTIQDKQGTPLKLVNGVATTALTTAPTVVNFQTPVKMVGGIDIITAGAVAATIDVWVNYYQ